MAASGLDPILRHIRALAPAPREGTTTDAQLLRRFIATRDEGAFAGLVRRHGPVVWGVCRRLLGDGPDAEDAFQATFLVLARRAGSLRRPESLASWLYGVALRVSQKARTAAARRRARERRVAVRPEAEGPGPAAGDGLGPLLDEELGRLPEKYRAPLVLCYLEGQTREEAARQLGWPGGTVCSRLARGRELLRRRLVRRGLTLAATALAADAGARATAAVPAGLLHAKLGAPLPAEAGIRPAAVHALAAEVMRTVSLAKLKAAAVVVLAGAVLAAGAGAALRRVAVADPPTGPAREPAPVPEAGRGARMDRYGDPLPPGVLARLGSVRLRHAGMTDLVFLSGGRSVLSAGYDHVLRTWDIAGGRPLRTVSLVRATSNGGIVLAADGKTAAAYEGAGRQGGKITVWETDTGKALGTVATGSADALCLAPDGKTVAAWRVGACVILGEWQTGKVREFIPPPRKFAGTDSTIHVRFSPDGKLLTVGGGWEEPLSVFEIATGRERHRLHLHASTSAFSPDSNRLAVASRHIEGRQTATVLRLIDVGTGREVAQFPLGAKEPYLSLSFAPDGRTLACGSWGQSCLLDTATGRVLHRLSGQAFNAMAFTPDGKTLAVGSYHGLRLWDVGTGKERQARPGDFGWRPPVAATPEGRLLAAVDAADDCVRLWDTAAGRPVRDYPLPADHPKIDGLLFTPDGRTLVAGDIQGRVQSWDVATGERRRTVWLQDPTRGARGLEICDQLSLNLSAAARRVYTVEHSSNGILRGTNRLGLWDADTGELLAAQPRPARPLRHAAWSPDGRTVVLGLVDGLEVRDVETGIARFGVAGTTPDVRPAWSPDSRLLAAPRGPAGAGQAPNVGVWEAATGAEVAAVPTGRVSDLALSADGRTLVAAGKQALHVWDLPTREERVRWPLPVTMPGGFDSTSGLLVLADGRRAFTALADGTGVIWDLGPAPVRGPADAVSSAEVAAWWADLAADDARRAYAAVWHLAEVPGVAVPFLRGKVRPVEPPDAAELQKRIRDLDDGTFPVRQAAVEGLKGLRELAAPAMRQALGRQPSLETRRRLEALLAQSAGRPDRERLRLLRAVQVLERAGTADARAVLARLAGGAPAACVTREAKESLDRLAGRPAAQSR